MKIKQHRSKYLSLVLGILAMTISSVSQANLDFAFDWAAAGDTNNTMSPTTNELKFTAESVLVFDQNTGTGVLQAHQDFTNYLILRIDQLFYNGGDVTESSYGNGDHGITILGILGGTQDTTTTYSIKPALSQLGVFYDYNPGYTYADFTNPSTFSDNGSLVELSNYLTGAGTNAPNIPDGAVDLKVYLQDLISNGDFEVDPNGGTLPALFAFTNANTALCTGTTQTCYSDPQDILDLFSSGLTWDPNTMLHTRDDGSIEKIAVPEPASLGLLGLGLLGMGATLRRRKVKK